MKKPALILGMLLVIGCSGGIDDPTFGSTESTGSSQLACVPGKTDECPCPNGDTGAQKCDDDGSKYLECVCDGSNGGGGNDSSTSSNSSSGTGGNDNSSSSSGSGGQECIPKTKEEACAINDNVYVNQMNCGFVDAGCDTQISCGTCVGNEVICGGFFKTSKFTIDGVCGQSYRTAGEPGSCSLFQNGTEVYTAQEHSELSLFNGQVPCLSLNDSPLSNHWCCKP